MMEFKDKYEKELIAVKESIWTLCTAGWNCHGVGHGVLFSSACHLIEKTAEYFYEQGICKTLSEEEA